MSISENMRKMMFTRRSMLLNGAQLGVAGLLAARMSWIAIAENEQWQLLSESNRVQLSLIPPRRGWILDRNGAPLASNRADFRVDIIPERLKNPEKTVDELGKVLGSANVADLLTKHVDRNLMEKHLRTMNIFFDWGRSTAAPTIEHSPSSFS